MEQSLCKTKATPPPHTVWNTRVVYSVQCTVYTVYSIQCSVQWCGAVVLPLAMTSLSLPSVYHASQPNGILIDF